MIDNKKVVALIPARGGSKTVPRKNLRPLGEKPLLAWPIDVARKAPSVDRVVVSTDDDDIAACAKEYRAEVERRPDDLSTDDSLVIDTIRYHLKKWKQEGRNTTVLVLLEPTCPFRNVDDIEQSLAKLVRTESDSVATFCEAEVNPWRTWRLGEGKAPQSFIDGADPWYPRQKLPEAYQLNGAVYAFFADRLPGNGKSLLFGEAQGVIIPKERSIDIDTELDFLIAEATYNEKISD